MASRLRGVNNISGDLIVDQSIFKVGSSHWSNFDKNKYQPYNAIPAGLMFNHRASKIEIIGIDKTNLIHVKRDFPDFSYKLVNNMVPKKVRCQGKYAWPKERITNINSEVTLELYGDYSPQCPPRNIYKVLTTPANMFYAGLKQTLQDAGGSLQGKLIIGNKPANGRLVYTHYSKPLFEIISTVNKESNNVMSRQILLSLGAKLYGSGVDTATGVRAVNNTLQKNGILDSDIKFSNGSGLSRSARLSATNLNNILRHSYKHNNGLLITLATMGRDGTLRKRLRNSVATNRAWMKTGSIRNVRSIAGYVRAESGRFFTVVILENHPRAKLSGKVLQDYIIEWLINNY